MVFLWFSYGFPMVFLWFRVINHCYIPKTLDKYGVQLHPYCGCQPMMSWTELIAARMMALSVFKKQNLIQQTKT